MSSVAQPLADRPPTKSHGTGWRNLGGLLPYLSRYKGGIALGLLVLAVMGVAGNVLPLIIGSIIDSLSGQPQPMAHLTGASRYLLRPLLSFYRPADRHALVIFS